MSRGTVHVVGAGLAGLAAAVSLVGEGHAVALYEAAQHAGGRCRSFLDNELGCRIDNGNHLLLAGNESAMAYLGMIGARDTLEGPDEAELAFFDVDAGRRWHLRPNRGRIPWWVLRAERRVPDTRLIDYLAVRRLRRAGADATVDSVLDPDATLFRRLWGPFAVAALNAAVWEASAALFGRVVAETLGRGGAACRPLAPRVGLSESLVDPALARLRAAGAEIRLGARLRRIAFAGERVAGLEFDGGELALGAADRVVLAVPAPVAARLVPDLTVPDDYAPIVNAHFRAEAPAGSALFVGVIGGTAEWVFRKRQVLSVTVSAADALVDRPAEELAPLLWGDVARVYGLGQGELPPWRIVKERRATFRATPAQLRRRPRPQTGWNNLFLAGDYVDTGLPATIEGAIRSGLVAAGLIAGRVPAG
ncbi:MAG TPA: hydroxysqualene dehydroxylase HpnE [Stellaceae bacterium]|jgi:squalene-associated FAD-dependent desaturase|nr:hydroxysqualene dehydroxylase HpnE [Stellaceae bacterium]